jgi:hypothetical protein
LHEYEKNETIWFLFLAKYQVPLLNLKDLRGGLAFDYSKFLMQMFELLYHLGLY